eukprot:m.185201 g.185201  ORF g.185201 m.185201 type:complete len:882 (+) comp16912_c0_seq7:1057-3702(+)
MKLMAQFEPTMTRPNQQLLCICICLAFSVEAIPANLEAAIAISFNTSHSYATSSLAANDDGVMLCESIQYTYRAPALRFVAFANNSQCVAQHPHLIRSNFGCSQVRGSKQTFVVVGESSVDQEQGEVFMVSSANFSRTVSVPLYGMAKNAAIAVTANDEPIVYIVEAQTDVRMMTIRRFGFNESVIDLATRATVLLPNDLETLYAALSLDGAQLFVTWEDSLRVLAFDTGTGRMTTFSFDAGKQVWGSPTSVLGLSPDHLLTVALGQGDVMDQIAVLNPDGALNRTISMGDTDFSLSYGFVTPDVVWTVQSGGLSNAIGKLTNASHNEGYLSVARTLPTSSWFCGSAAGYSNGYLLIACDSTDGSTETRLLFYQVEDERPVRSWCPTPETTTTSSTFSSTTILSTATAAQVSSTQQAAATTLSTCTSVSASRSSSSSVSQSPHAAVTTSDTIQTSISSVPHRTSTTALPTPPKSQSDDQLLKYVGIAIGVTFCVALALVVWYYTRFKRRVAASSQADYVPLHVKGADDDQHPINQNEHQAERFRHHRAVDDELSLAAEFDALHHDPQVVAAVAHAVITPEATPIGRSTGFDLLLEDPSSAPLNQSSKETGGSLEHALKQQDVNLLQSLMAQGVSPDTVDKDGRTVLFTFATTSWSSVQVASKALSILADSGSGLESWQAIQDQSALHIATIYGCYRALEALLARGAPLFEQNAKLETPLIVACQQGSDEAVALMLSMREVRLEQLNMHDAMGLTCLHWAVKVGAEECIRHLLERGPELCDMSRTVPLEDTILHLAARENNVETLRYMLLLAPLEVHPLLYLTNAEEATVEDVARLADAQEVLALVDSVKADLANDGETAAMTYHRLRTTRNQSRWRRKKLK